MLRGRSIVRDQRTLQGNNLRSTSRMRRYIMVVLLKHRLYLENYICRVPVDVLRMRCLDQQSGWMAGQHRVRIDKVRDGEYTHFEHG